MNTRRLVSIAVFTALIIIGGLISVYIPFTHISLSFQTVFVIMAGILLGGRDGALASLVYLAMGLLGLPVFTKGGGLGYVMMPSFGYLIGFPIGAFVAGALCSRLKTPTRGKVFLCGMIGMAPVYIVGITYQVLILYYYTGIGWAAAIGVLPTMAVLLLKDSVLCGFVAILYPSLRRVMRSRAVDKRKNTTAFKMSEPD